MRWVDYRLAPPDWTTPSPWTTRSSAWRRSSTEARVVISEAAFTVWDRRCGLIAACPETAGAAGRRALDAGWRPCSISNSPRSDRAALLRRRSGHSRVRHRATG
ncbi:hypothetical protein AB0J35_60805 [Nonomuraea angiospora]|uniref:hypothetical protein n=1 Tax=Nonomuraea angiospora TaxID=46172 RepID=UPI003448D3C8